MEFAFPEKHFKHILFSGDGRLVLTVLCLHKQGKQHRASLYKQGSMAIKTAPEIEIASHMVASFIHLCIRPPSPMPLGSGKPPWPLAHIKLSYHYGKDINVLPLPLCAMACGREIPLLETHSRSVLCRGRVSFGRSPSLQYWGISAHS